MKKLTLFLSLLLFFEAGAQNFQSPLPKSNADTAISFYFASLDETLPIHNGRVFYGYPGIIENAFYPSGGWHKGSVLFDGIWYHDVSLMYDTYMDEVIILHPTNTPVRLISERIEQFKYEGFHFERINPGKTTLLKSGFYQHLVDGSVSILARRSKKIEENIIDLAIERKFVVTDQYFAVRDGIYTPIYKQRPLLELMKDKRQGVLQNLKQQNLKFKKSREKAIIAMAEFYNQSPD